MRFKFTEQPELSAEVAVDTSRVREPQYGRWLDEFTPGQVFVHPRGYTFERAEIRAFATTFMQCNPLYLNLELARAHGFDDLPASPQHVFNVVLSLGVQNDSEKAMANLGYYQARFLRPVYPGDTVRALTRVVSQRDRGADKPGIAHIQTLGLNQRNEVVLQYERKIMVRHRPDDAAPAAPAPETAAFPWEEAPECQLPIGAPAASGGLTGPNTYFEDFAPGDIIVHANGRTITDEHLPWTYRVGNTHPLHYDRVYSTGLSGAMSGEPIVYGGLVFAWLEGLASRDVSENALWELGFTEGYHTQPAVSGDTVAAVSRVLACEPAPDDQVELPCGVVTLQLIGVKNISAAEAVSTFGQELFLKEGAKKKLGKQKIDQKIFEIERRLLIKRRAGLV
jgi:2-methylfumaryl-CoA hydratase